jgi:hypothetical protein
MKLVPDTSNSPGLVPVRPFPLKYRIPFSGLLFLVVPVVFLLATEQLTRVSGPHWLGTNFENSYTYLFNSLLLVKGQTPFMIGHPGTTTQLFGATVLRVSVSGRTDEVVETVLGNPEKFIKRIQRLMLIFTAVCIWIFPWLTAVYIGSCLGGLLVQIPSLLFVTLLRYAAWFGSDLMLVPFCIAGICLCVVLMHQQWSGEQRQWALVLAGIVCALGIVTKLTFFPLIFIILAVCSGLRNRLVAVTSFAVVTVVALIPIYPRLWELWAWIFGIATHVGYYGSGDVGLINVDTYFPTIGLILSREPMVALIPTLATLVVVALSALGPRFAPGGVDWRLVWSSLGLFALQLLSFLFVAKHANFHYFIPLYLSVALNLLLLYGFCRNRAHPALLRILSISVLIGLIGWALSDATLRALDTYVQLRDSRDQQIAVYKRVRSKVPSDLRVEYYRSASPRWAQYFGNQWAGRYFAAVLGRKYPHALFYNIFNGSFENFASFIPRADVLAQHDHLYFFGNRYDQRKIPICDRKDLLELDSGGGFFLDEWKRR